MKKTLNRFLCAVTCYTLAVVSVGCGNAATSGSANETNAAGSAVVSEKKRSVAAYEVIQQYVDLINQKQWNSLNDITDYDVSFTDEQIKEKMGITAVSSVEIIYETDLTSEEYEFLTKSKWNSFLEKYKEYDNIHPVYVIFNDAVDENYETKYHYNGFNCNLIEIGEKNGMQYILDGMQLRNNLDKVEEMGLFLPDGAKEKAQVW